MLSRLSARLSLSPGQTVLARALLVGSVALLIRVLFLLDFTDQPLFDANLARGTDMEFLIGWARRIAAGDLLGRGSGPFWWAPLFPYSLGAILAVVGHDNLVGAAFVQAAFGASTASLLYLLGRRLLDETTGLLAGLMAAIYGTAIFYAGVLLSTTLETFLAVALLLVVTEARSRPTALRWLAAGAVAGLACLARPNFLLGVAVLWCLLPVLVPRADGRIDWVSVRRAAVAFGLGAVLLIAPVTARNWLVGGRLVLVSAAGPETFRIANSYDSTPMNFVYPKKPRMPLTSADFWRHQGRKAVLFWWGFEPPQNVNYYLAREMSSFLRLPWLTFWLAVPMAALGLWVTRERAPALAHVHAFLGAYYVSVVVFFIIARWRLPLILPLLMFTAAGFLALLRWARTARWRPLAAGTLAVVVLAAVVHPGPGPFVFAADHGALGYILANRGNYREAASELAVAAAGFPQDGRLQRDLGLLLDRIGQHGKARRALERAVVLTPDDAASHRYLGRLLLGPDGDPGRARAHLTRALALDPQGPASGQVRALLEKLDRGGVAP